MRLDDASEYMDVEKWQRMEDLLDKYHIKPIVGVIPNNQDPDMVGVYPKDEQFWEKVQRWKEKGWTIALHGYTHRANEYLGFVLVFVMIAYDIRTKMSKNGVKNETSSSHR